MRIETYQLKAANGKPIRKATKVIFADGSEVKFIERMSKQEALKQVTTLTLKFCLGCKRLLHPGALFADGYRDTHNFCHACQRDADRYHEEEYLAREQ